MAFTAVSTLTSLNVAGSSAWTDTSFAEIDAVTCYQALADTIQYNTDGGAFGGDTVITGNADIPIGTKGAYVKFGASGGHTLNDYWTITTGVLPALSVYSDGGTTKQFEILDTVPTYANNAAALSGGLTAGQVYKTSAGALMIVV